MKNRYNDKAKVLNISQNNLRLLWVGHFSEIAYS
jgi:DNA-binding Xre family transcriptional regulator